MNRLTIFLSTVSLVLLGATVLRADSGKTNRVLVIGIDGLRADALRAANTPAIDSLIENGCFTEATKILGERYQENDTVSGPGWSSFLTGVWADKHGVDDNKFAEMHYDRFPHFFARIKESNPNLKTASLVDWEPIDKHIVSGADHRFVFPAHGADEYSKMDTQIADKATEILSENDIHAMMVYFGAVDETGHKEGFHPSVPPYLKAIETVDGKVQRLLDAMKTRPNITNENWLVVVSTDHGGRGKGHGGGHDVAEINTTFLIVSGENAQKGILESPTYVVDVPATAMAHLGIDLDPEWKLDGRPVGLANQNKNR